MIKNSLPFQRLQLPILQGIEATGITLLTHNGPIQIGSTYKRPENPLVRPDLEALRRLGDRVILAGDLNAKHRQWNSRTSNQAGLQLHAFLPFFDFETIAPTEPTHFPRHGGRPDMLDLALVARVDIVDGPISVNALDSDHNPVYMAFSVSLTLPTPRERTQKTADWNEYRRYLIEEVPHLQKPQTEEDIDDSTNNLTSLIQTALKPPQKTIVPQQQQSPETTSPF